MKIAIVHLSDIHIKSASDAIIKRADAIARATFPLVVAAEEAFVVISGDVAFSGLTAEYVAAADFVSEIVGVLRKEKKKDVHLVIAPGNHDCDFAATTRTRDIVIGSFSGAKPREMDDSVIEQCTSVQSAFFDFRRKLERTSVVFDDRLWRTHMFTGGDVSICFEAINLSWVSKRKEEPGALCFPVDKYSSGPVEAADLRIVVMHHPFNWLNQPTYRPLRKHLRSIAHIIFTGHEHEGNVGINSDSDSATSAYVEGNVLQRDSHDLTGSSFGVVSIDTAAQTFSATQFLWNGTRYSADSSERPLTHYGRLPQKKPLNPLTLTEQFGALIDDPGAAFHRAGGAPITLSDIFVYPDLQSVAVTDSVRTYETAQALEQVENVRQGVLIEGDDKSGRTSLFRQLLRAYHDQGYIPLYLDGGQLKRSDDDDLNRVMRSSIRMQYGKDGLEPFDQTPRDRKVLLLDDLDESSIRSPEARKQLMQFVEARFGLVLVSVDRMFEVKDLVEGDGGSLARYVHYNLQPFNFSRRSRLIEKWFSLNDDGGVDPATHIERCDHAEKIVDAVMARNIVPSVPIYILTLMQGIEAGRVGDFKDSALGHYYQYLLVDAFKQANVANEKLTEYFQYCTHLAWYFHRSASDAVSEQQLRDYNREFSSKWVTVDFTDRLAVLLRARILLKWGDEYSFRYPYIYFFFKGLYLNQTLGDLDTRAYVSDCCRHLYKRDSANTILFLAHHTNEPFVLQSISDTVHSTFKAHLPVTFEGDVDGLLCVLRDVPQWVYSNTPPEKMRKRRNAIRDDLERETGGELEEPRDSESIAAQFMTLSRTAEILGQVLKTQYAKIDRARKVELLDELFSGPLRALRDFYLFVEKRPEPLAEAAKALFGGDEEEAKKETAIASARKYVSTITLAVSHMFISKAASSANADSLTEDVRTVVKKKGTLAYRLIEMAILLDSARPLPAAALKKLVKDTSGNLIAARILQSLVLTRLYMFRTTEKDMQLVAKELGLDIKGIHAVGYGNKRVRRLN